uniref:LITAF domain-containing protein n=1 Tax=Attheya septentrionalis TaxID=420275 RepID=A0A7S2UEK6_9STRA|mmetsp:Transcript_22603/g.40791  ORF Transcript_22603/g.40791 Transcript_22603/m.40791 type:complete len:256 (+) Transcript_22603:241-1008(+)|eukprot:CAMPEP_0198299658 /NCGR_PEP_ID=MMETSP1449-20131203/45579_1 /TAXON_ID=420275 /ORGANISM="Attheya septentrionalis, Strain CCMP2084" /LENGTH=255 /DNA_ID=CAMNT_0044001285 /DNA_START=206 /DNA_END=973 /DNA_ORIENTATION=+
MGLFSKKNKTAPLSEQNSLQSHVDVYDQEAPPVPEKSFKKYKSPETPVSEFKASTGDVPAHHNQGEENRSKPPPILVGRSAGDPNSQNDTVRSSLKSTSYGPGSPHSFTSGGTGGMNSPGNCVSVSSQPVQKHGMSTATSDRYQAANDDDEQSVAITLASKGQPATQSADDIFPRGPVQITSCPHCQYTSRTTVKTYPTYLTWLSSFFLVLVFWPLCWVPLVLEKAKQSDHFCAVCEEKVGEVKPYEDCCVVYRR